MLIISGGLCSPYSARGIVYNEIRLPWRSACRHDPHCRTSDGALPQIGIAVSSLAVVEQENIVGANGRDFMVKDLTTHPWGVHHEPPVFFKVHSKVTYSTIFVTKFTQ